MLFGLAFAASAVAQEQKPPFRAPEGVEIRRDVVYTRYGAREMRLDLFLPNSGKAPFPGVVYIHGGGWRGGSKSAFERQAAHMATRGFIGAAIEYRLSGEAKYPAAIDDARAALRYLRENAKALRLDAARIGAAGGSAGGHLVSLLGVHGEVRAVAAFNPAVDFLSLGQRGPTNADNSIAVFLGKPLAEGRAIWVEASPIEHVSAKSAPTLFLHGTADTTVPFQQSTDMMAKLKAAGVRAELFRAEGAGHGFFNRSPWYEPTLEAMEKFFVELLGKPRS